MSLTENQRFSGHIDSPIGRLNAIVDGHGAVVRLDFDAPWKPRHIPAYDTAVPNLSALAPLADQLADYFSGTRQSFDLPLAPEGSDFLKSAWALLSQIPYATTVTYGELARAMTKPTSARAMGMANAVNPISIIVPCHRVIGAGGKLTGYGGGLHNKQALLLLEAEHGAVDRLI